MRQIWQIRGAGGILIGGLLLATLVWAETLELQTYYPSPPASNVPDPLYVDAAAIGSDLNPTPTPPLSDGVLLVDKNLGIGTADPKASLHVAGNSIFGIGEGTATPSSAVLRGAAGSGTDISGGSLEFRGGQGTGEGAGGSLIFVTSPAGTTSGSTANPWREAMRITDTGNVGIGTTTPSQPLEVAGNSKTDTLIFNANIPAASLDANGFPLNPVDGMTFLNKLDTKLYTYYNNGNADPDDDWRAIVSFETMVLDTKKWSSGANQTLTGDFKVIDTLNITALTPRKGLYSVTLKGMVEVDAKEGKAAVIQILSGDGAVMDTLYFYDDYDEDIDDDGIKDPGEDLNNNGTLDEYVGKNGMPTQHLIDWGTIIYLKDNRNPNIRAVGKKSGKNNQNSSAAVRDGAYKYYNNGTVGTTTVTEWELKAELILPF